MTKNSVPSFNKPAPDWMDEEWHQRVVGAAKTSPTFAPDKKPGAVAPAGGDPNYKETYDRLCLEPARQREAAAKAAPRPGVTITYTDAAGRRYTDTARTMPVTDVPDVEHVRTDIERAPDGGIKLTVFFRVAGRDRSASIMYPGADLGPGRNATNDAAAIGSAGD